MQSTEFVALDFVLLLVILRTQIFLLKCIINYLIETRRGLHGIDRPATVDGQSGLDVKLLHWLTVG